MGEDTEGLRRDNTRDELTRDVDALTEKVSPSRIVDRGIERTKGRLSSVKDRVMEVPETLSARFGKGSPQQAAP